MITADEEKMILVPLAGAPTRAPNLDAVPHVVEALASLGIDWNDALARTQALWAEVTGDAD